MKPKPDDDSAGGPRDETNADWITVCVRCYRVKRGGTWTDEESHSRGAGTSTGFCDRCFEELRAEQRRSG